MSEGFSGFRVRVPATTANLGPGFDAFGMALTIYNEFAVRFSASGLVVAIEGEGAGELAPGADNLFVQAFARAFAAAGAAPPAIDLRMQNNIPLARGLGSSASAAVGGLVAANRILGNVLSADRLLQLACEIEGHPDNVAAALFGGLIVCAAESGAMPTYARVPVPGQLQAVVCVPDQHLPTALARKVVPQEVCPQRRGLQYRTRRVAPDRHSQRRRRVHSRGYERPPAPALPRRDLSRDAAHHGGGSGGRCVRQRSLRGRVVNSRADVSQSGGYCRRDARRRSGPRNSRTNAHSCLRGTGRRCHAALALRPHTIAVSLRTAVAAGTRRTS